MKKLSLLILTIVFAITICGISAAGNVYTVKAGQDTNLTACNYNNTYSSNTIPQVSAKGNTATSSINVNTNENAKANAEVGYQWVYDTNGKSLDEVKNCPIKITVDLSYSINSYYSNGGNSGAGVNLDGSFNNMNVHHIITFDVSGGSKNSHYNNSFYTDQNGNTLTMGNVNFLGVAAWCWANTPPKYDGTSSNANSFATVTINRIEVEFLPDISVESVTGPTNASAGQTINVDAVVKNLGIIKEGKFDVYIGISDENGQLANTESYKTQVESLGLSETQNITGTITIPEDLESGKYLIGAIANPTGAEPPEYYLDNNHKSYEIEISPQPDLAVSLDYKKYVQNKPSVNKDNIYGTDKVYFIIKVTNNGFDTAKDVTVNFKLPDKFKFLDDTPSGYYNDHNGVWKIDSLEAGDSDTLNVIARAVKNGKTKLEVSIPSENDPNPDNNHDNATINIHNPVVLVHGFISSPSTWNGLISKFKKYGITYYNFGYNGLQDPYSVTVNVFAPWMVNKQNQYNYKGKFDIVCHSMGALVTRYYMENNGNRNAKYIGQWIGLGAINRGAAIEDVIRNPRLNWSIYFKLHSNRIYILILALIPTYSQAAINMQTTTQHIINLNKDGIASFVKYRLILGRNIQQIPGLDTVEKSGKTYRFTTNGDGIVANAQSLLSGAASTVYVNVNHTGLPNSNQVQNLIINYLKNT